MSERLWDWEQDEKKNGRSLGLLGKNKKITKKKMSHPVQSPPESLIRVQSLPGLVEEDVSRLRVLGDV